MEYVGYGQGMWAMEGETRAMDGSYKLWTGDVGCGWVSVAVGRLCVHMLLMFIHCPKPDTGSSSWESLALPIVDKYKCDIRLNPRRWCRQRKESSEPKT